MNLREAAQQALEALEMSTRFVYADNRPQCENAINALRAALEPVTDCHDKEGDKLSPPLERHADTSKTSDVPETNFGNMAQSVNSIEANHIPDATKMVEECAYPECLSTNGCEKQCPAFPRSKDDHINGVRRRDPGNGEEMTHKLDATVFVYRHRDTKEIKARYMEDARELDSSEEWAHVATLEPRMWIQYHYDDMIRERQLCADLCRSLAPSQREMNRTAYDNCHMCADEIERRGEVQEYRP